MLNLMRQDKTQKAYWKYREEPHDCIFCEHEPIKKFKYWAIKENDFPYDRITDRHLLLYTIRHTDEPNTEELRELRLILKVFEDKGYADAILKNFKKNQSIKNHLHFHLITYKKL